MSAAVTLLQPKTAATCLSCATGTSAVSSFLLPKRSSSPPLQQKWQPERCEGWQQPTRSQSWAAPSPEVDVQLHHGSKPAVKANARIEPQEQPSSLTLTNLLLLHSEQHGHAPTSTQIAFTTVTQDLSPAPKGLTISCHYGSWRVFAEAVELLGDEEQEASHPRR